MEALLHINGCCVFEPRVDRPSQPVGQNGEGFALALFMLQHAPGVLAPLDSGASITQQLRQRPT